MVTHIFGPVRSRACGGRGGAWSLTAGGWSPRPGAHLQNALGSSRNAFQTAPDACADTKRSGQPARGPLSPRPAGPPPTPPAPGVWPRAPADLFREPADGQSRGARARGEEEGGGVVTTAPVALREPRSGLPSRCERLRRGSEVVSAVAALHGRRFSKTHKTVAHYL